MDHQMKLSTQRRFFLGLCVAVVAACLVFTPIRATAADGPPPVYVTLWFDTEDYLLPADDDAAKRLAELLTKRDIRATFKVVGEKARTLERRGRKDVIEALNHHAIGFHSNFHSVHPTTAEYMAECGWLDGVAEFARREGPGAADVRRIFGVDRLVCYGQPGSAWSAQAIAALPQIGVAPVYLDSGNQVGLDGKPFWYAGALNVFNMRPNETRMDLHDRAALEPAEREVSAIAERLRHDGGGLISIFYHPCEWVHKEFWDGVNFSRGRNPPREKWMAPPQLEPAETEAAFKQFEAYIDHIRGLPGVRFVTAGDFPAMYGTGAIEGDLDKSMPSQLAGMLVREDATLNFEVVFGTTLSPADQFAALIEWTSRAAASERVEQPLKICPLMGPDAPPPAPLAAAITVDWPAYRAALADVCDYLKTTNRIPPRVYIGPDAISPAAFLRLTAKVVSTRFGSRAAADQWTVDASDDLELLTARRIAKDSPRVYGDWIIHRANWRVPKLLEIARLQAWTLKPAWLRQN